MQYGPKIVTDSLVLALDAADNNSAPHNDLPVKQGCVTWLDGADDDVFSYSSGTLVSQWRDKSGNDNHVSQSTTSSQPTRNRTLNSKSVVDFDGSNDSLSSSNSLTLSSGHTMFAVTLTDAFSSDAGLISINNQLSNGITIHTSGLAYFYFGSGGYNTTQSVSTSTSYILTKVWTGATSGNRISYKNGTQGYSTGTMANSSSTGVLRLGQQTTYYNGYIAEVVIYDRELSQGEITKVHNYLQNKWNISVSDTKWYDQTANANNGTPTNDPTYSDTNKGYFNFDGTNDYISIADDTTLDITGDITISCWVSLNSSQNGLLCILVNKRDTSDYTSPYYMFFEDRGGENKFGVLLGGGSPNYVVAGSNNNFDGVYGKWDHVCFTVSGTTVSLYVNGVFDTSGTFTGTRQTNNVPLRLGGSYTNGFLNYMMSGKMANVLIYNEALTAAEVLQNYNATKSRFT